MPPGAMKDKDTMTKRTPFPKVFWAANSIEVLERFAYYSIYMGFGIYMEYLGFTRAQLGIVQSIFLLFSYFIPVISGSFADRYGFKKVLLVSYLAYLPSILLLLLTRSFSGIALTMLSIGLAAGIFKPLVSGTVRTITDKTNKTLGFGIFYAMVNIGASFGPLIAGRLRVLSWNHVFLAAAIAIAAMFLITLLFYKEPERIPEGKTLSGTFRDLGVALSDLKFLSFLVILGVLYWLPVWAFYNLLALYVDKNLDTALLYRHVRGVLGTGVAHFLSRPDADGGRRILGETISHSGYIVMLLQIPVSRICEKFRAIPTFLTGLLLTAGGYALILLARLYAPALVFLGILAFAVGEMVSSPRIQEYITWLAPREKAGLYMGTHFLAMGLGGALSGFVYTTLYGRFRSLDHPEAVWGVMAAHILLGVVVILLFVKKFGTFKELEA